MVLRSDHVEAHDEDDVVEHNVEDADAGTDGVGCGVVVANGIVV